jgi:hypothetical protein
MIEPDQDEAAFAKIMEAAERIADMAQSRPAEAATLLERAKYLRSLAEEIRRDWEKRFAEDAPVGEAADESALAAG